MKPIDPRWLKDFDSAMVAFFAIDHTDAGMCADEIGRYADLSPKEAVLAYGVDYDLCRVDTFWS